MLLKIALSLFFVLCFAYWFVQFLLVMRVIHSVKVLETIKPVTPRSWPRVSVIIPARNEAKTISPAFEKRLHDDYPNIEFILINDRSEDNTGELIEYFATNDTRVKPLHIRTLPEGWLGKVHALNQCVKMAPGNHC